MATQDSLFDLFEPEPEHPEPPQKPQPRREPAPRAANDPEVQRRIDALVPCRACPRRTSREWAAFSGGLCLVCSPLESEDWLAERKRGRSKEVTG